jgi:hypothetical protein
MTSPIQPIQGPTGSPDSTPRAGEVPSHIHAFKTQLDASDHALASEVDAGAPPAEVLDQIATAGRISRQLSETGHELRFSEEHGGRVKVELQDRGGNTVRTMLIAEALELAAGKQLG